PVYLGPTLFMPLIAVVLLKMIRICKAQRITSIADFISSRYGKNNSLGVLGTVFSVIGIVPYIAIQLKAISASLNLLTGYSDSQHTLLTDTTFYTAIGLAVFSSIYGIRSVDTTERHAGVVSAIAFESIIKLFVFVLMGVYICFFIFPNVQDILQQAISMENLKQHFVIPQSTSAFSWFLIALVSALAILLLPRQFQVGVVENTNEQHVKKAMWIFPLYLLLINLFVLPVAMAGVISFPQGIDMDMILLHFPMAHHQTLLAVLVFIGGFSAATGMVIVELIALTTMMSNHISIPILLRNTTSSYGSKKLISFILWNRRAGVFILILLAYVFEKFVAEQNSLVSIGLISFAAVAQFAPSVLFGMYWKQANRKAAVVSIVLGFAIWFYTLVLPSFASASGVVNHICQHGLFEISILKPTALLGMTSLDSVSHGILWSLLFNVICFVGVSLKTKAGIEEIHQANLFVDAEAVTLDEVNIWRGTTYFKDVLQVLSNFLGPERSKVLIEGYSNRHSIKVDEEQEADPRIVSFVERILGGVIGAASSRLLVSSVTKEEKISLDEVIDIVKESQQIIELNKELRKKSQELSKASNELGRMNDQLLKMDELKNEFLYTVTHELRTPLTSIRALSEIVYDNPELDDELKQEYLNIIIKETEKLSHLITQVLNLEKYESGRQKIHASSFNVKELVEEVMASLRTLGLERKLHMTLICPDSIILLHADRDLIRQVIYNLVANAIKFAHSHIEIFISPFMEDTEIRVKDDGDGINELTKDLLFDKFYQSKQQHLQKPEGSGLGLAICKKIIDMHHGKISAENNHGKGASFIFVLPNIY
nr:ATP-binding protein [Chitinophagaceae bacterium]